MTTYEKPKRVEYIPLWGYFAMKSRMRRVEKTYRALKISAPPARMHFHFSAYHYYCFLVLLNLFTQFGMDKLIKMFFP